MAFAAAAGVRNKIRYFLILFFFLAEVLLLTFCRNAFGPYVSPLAFYGAGLMLAILAYRHFQKTQVEISAGYAASVSCRLWICGISLTTCMWLMLRMQKVLAAYPIQVALSDIIPALQVYVKRFLAGERIYTPFTRELGYYGTPGYLPLHWLPYVPAELLALDYRWLAFAIFLLGVAAYNYWLLRQEPCQVATFLKALLPPLVLLAVLITDPSTLGLTVETLIYGYYFIFIAAVFSRSPVLQVLGLLLCLLSRYALVLWVPLYLVLLFFQAGRRQALLVATGVLAGILSIYVLPYLSQDWGMFMRVQQEYSQIAAGEWAHLEPASEVGHKPYHLYKGLGMAAYFYAWGGGSLLERILLLKAFHFFFSGLVVVVAGIVYFSSRHKIDYRLFALISLKVYLATFYHFIQVPYLYLTALSVFVSVFLLVFLPGKPPAPAKEALAASC